MSKKNNKIRRGARDEDCTVNVVGVCNYNPATTVLAHIQLPGCGIMGGKVNDLSGCYACSDCHDFIDRRNGMDKHPEQAHRLEYMLKGVINTKIRQVEQGLLGG